MLESAEKAATAGGWVAGFVAYEAAPAFDDALVVRERDLDDPLANLPLAEFVVFDRHEFVAPFEPRTTHPAPYSVSTWLPEVERSHFDKGLAAIKVRIGSDDVYQVNHTFRLRAAFAGDPFELYRDLVLAQRGAYGAYLDLDRYRILSASPERFVGITGRRITTRPMKGTSARGRWPAEDTAAADRLLASGKDRAENLMVVDLLRNDLGRIAEPGSIDVEGLLELERYETVWQLTSKITADMRSGVAVADVFAALFPSGSITGTPKTAAMGIIADQEVSPRGVYCGAVGFIEPGGDAQFNVAIRTVTVDVEEGVAEYGVGGGITWASSIEGEYEEARAKARVLVERRPEFSLVEAMRWDRDGGWWWLDRHLDRLEASASYFGFAVDRAAVATRLEGALTGDAAQRVRVLVDRSGSTTTDSGPLDGSMRTTPGGGDVVRLTVDAEHIASSNVFRFHKTTQAGAARAVAMENGAPDDVILVNERDEIAETTVRNVALRFDDRWLTPTLDSGCLPGVMRAVLLDAGVVEEAVIPLALLGDADEVAVFNSVRGWQPALVID